MRIAQVAPLAESVPPRLYGGTERVVSYLTDALAALGHEVTLFASGDSVTDAANSEPPPADWEAGLILMGQRSGELIPFLGPAWRPAQPQGGEGAAQAEVVRLDEHRQVPDRTRRQGGGAGSVADAWTPEDWTGVPGGSRRRRGSARSSRPHATAGAGPSLEAEAPILGSKGVTR